MIRKAGLLFVAVLACAVFVSPAVALDASDMDTSGFPKGAKIVSVNTEIEVCAEPWRMKFIELPGPPTRKWIKVPKKKDARYAHDWAWVLVEYESDEEGKEWEVEGMRCIKKCPSTKRDCVEHKDFACPVCPGQ